MASVEINRRLFLTADRSRVVEAGDPEAAFLYATPGKRIPTDEAERYGLLGNTPEAVAEPAPEIEPESAPDLTAEEKVDRLQAEPAEEPPPKVAEPASKRSRKRTRKRA